jgi:hypothetical protein
MLQTDPKKKVDPKNTMQYWVLNNQAKAIVKLNGSQMEEFDAHVADWSAAQQAAQISSFSDDFTSGSGYEALRDMGTPAIPLIMDRYANDQGNWWHELLHEIVHGAKSGAQTYDSTALYQQWSDWFQGQAGTALPPAA